MNLVRELVEILIALAPSFMAYALIRRTPTHIKGWFIQVLGTSVVVILAIGLLLMRLTGDCDSTPLSCDFPSVNAARVPGIFKACQFCSAQNREKVSTILNLYAVDVQALSAALALICSAISTCRFMRWAKRVLKSHKGS